MKIIHARKARRGGEREKWGTTDKAQAFDPSRPTDFGVWSSYPLPNQLSASNRIPSLIDLSLLLPSIKCRGDISLGFVCSPSFFSLTAASCLSRVRWFSRALAFRSFHYPLRKMGTTRSLANRVLLAVSSPMRNNISCRAELGRLPLLIPIYQKIMKYFVYDLNNNDNDSIFKQSFLMSKKSTFYKEFMILFQFHKHVWKIQSNQFRYRIFR